MDSLQWLPTGANGLASLLAAIRRAEKHIRLETFIYRDGAPGREIALAMAEAAQRGVQVAIHVDALGSKELPPGFWSKVTLAGGDVRVFNPFGSGRYLTRSHRKLCVVDDTVAFVTGFNIGPEYNGDGVTQGWRDVGVAIRGPSVAALASVFDQQFQRPDKRPGLLARFQRRREYRPPRPNPAVEILPVGPGRHASCLMKSLYADMAKARRIWLCSPYFLPSLKLRQLLRRAARRGADVRLVLPAKNDVALSYYAARHLYSAMLRNRIRIYEYLPQMLHAKAFQIDDAIYVGSSNLDQRSLHLNHELMIRCTEPGLRAAAEQSLRELFIHSQPINPKSWSKQRRWRDRFRERWSFFLLYRVDSWLTHRFSN